MEISVSDLISILLKKLWIIIICIVLFTVSTFLITHYVIDKEYTASVSMYVQPNTESVGQIASLNELNYAKEVVNTYIEILKTDIFMRSVSRASGLGYSAGELKEKVTMSIVNDTEIFKVEVTTIEPDHSYILADTIARLAPAKIIEIKNADAVRLVDPAVVPTEPSAPNVMLNTLIGFTLGLIAGVMIAIILEVMDKRVKNEDDLIKHYNLPILGMIPKMEEK